ncbi:MAG TPA: prolyl oligopeptidase family serine peptidase [Chitinophagaceae bacterium]|nr:prolyl oligopeptidase family serine peptidase [Chitinophagaceae bacterium]
MIQPMRFRKIIPMICIAMLLVPSLVVRAQNMVANTDEQKVPPYTLPDPLRDKNGKSINTLQAWKQQQRPYIFKRFEENVYGRFPRQQLPLRFKVTEEPTRALDGKATRKQVRIFFGEQSNAYLDLLIYLPATATGPVPVFTGYNFGGNHTVSADTGIYLSQQWVDARGKGVVNNKATAASRGASASQWQVEEILSHGYGLAVAYYGDIEPDHPDGWKTGIRTTLSTALHIQPSEWGAIGAWAWGLSHIMDYLQQDKTVDAKKVAVMGHSRLGKAALWAAAADERFGMVVSNESGEGGAALSKRWYGETVAIINEKFPHWFSPNYKKYNDNTAALPVDQHMLLALMAPRPLYVASAEGDQWSDPKGEFLAARNAGIVYALFGKKGIEQDTMPGLQQPVGNTIRYHYRAGKHDVTLYDWQQYLSFADSQWKN